MLSGLFFMLTLGAYDEYVRHPASLKRYLAIVVVFCLGLLAKPMLVTLPPLLLLLDYWPLGRIGRPQADLAVTGRRGPPPAFPWRVVLDKLPLAALAAAAAGVTMLTHGDRPNPLSWSERFDNAAVAAVAYLGQLFVPVGLTPFYSHPEAGWPAWHVAAATALLLAITLAAVIGRRAYPYFFVGWFWYLGLLVPVLGFVLIGPHARADRYTYLSQIGLYIALVWGAMQLGAAWSARRWVFGIGSALLLTALLVCSWRQTGFWQDDRALWSRALACEPDCAMAHCNLGVVLDESGDVDQALEQYRLALEMGPRRQKIYSLVLASAHDRLGNLAEKKGDLTLALDEYRQAVAAEPALFAAQMRCWPSAEISPKPAAFSAAASSSVPKT